MGGFKPAGELARWKYLYELLKSTPDGGIITYDDMAKELDMDPVEDRGAIHAAWYRACREHEEQDRRAVEVVRGVGYRLVAPKEQLELALKHQRRSTTALAKSQSKVVNVRSSELDAETRRRFRVAAQLFAQQLEFNQRMESRMERTEQHVKSLVEHRERTEEQREEMHNRLTRLEQILDGHWGKK